MSIVVLMYHALYRGEAEWASLAAEERPYAVACEVFEQQLDALSAAGIPVLDPEELLGHPSGAWPKKGVVLTFDDGHESFYRHAFPLLRKRGYRAIFFITSDLVEAREDFCTWDALREMADEGNWIQAHGKTHRFLSDLSRQEVTEELSVPAQVIAANTGQPIQSISFPGGRFGAREIELGRTLGYRSFFGSFVGVLRQPAREGSAIPRIAIRHNTNLGTFVALAKGSVIAVLPRQLAYQLKNYVRSLLGNRIYHGLYRKLSS